jgi:pyruvate dehydrogenase E2 component (dihydrolipoamide acetyltransferase)
MPQLGYDMQEGTVVRWRKKEGEVINRGEILAEIETDKAVVEMESHISGVVGKLVVGEGTMVPVSQPIAVITELGEVVPDIKAVPVHPKKVAAHTPEHKPTHAARESAPPESAGPVKASPIAKRLADEKGIDLKLVKGTGPGGRITESDVRASEEPRRKASPMSATAPSLVASSASPIHPAEPQRVRLSKMRLAIGRRTSDSKRQAPHFYVGASVNMTKALDMRKELNQSLTGKVHITINDMIVKAVAQAMKKFPNLNSTFEDDHLILHPDVNVGIVLAIEPGIIVPAIMQAQNKSLTQISQTAKDLVKRAQEGTLKPEEYGGATFSISNLGMFDVDEFIAIIMPPNSAMLGVGSVKPQPTVRDGQICVTQVMKVTISVDHRVTDGVEAARFLTEFRKLLEEPLGLLI